MPPATIDPGHPYAQTKHISFTFHKQKTSPAPFGYEYYLSLPPAYDASPEKRWPLLLFLHGAGESQRGRGDSYASLRHGVPKIILCYDRMKAGEEPTIEIPPPERRSQARGKRAPPGDLSVRPVPPEVCTLVAERFITLTPSLDMSEGYGWNAKVLSALLDEVVRENRIDVDAVHVSGFSMGGYGTWALAMETPARFASLVPICGGGDAARAKITKHIPQWIHHGEQDDIVPIGQSEQMDRALRRAAAVDVTFTRYPDAAHDSWTAAYENAEVFRWMLGKRRTEGGEEIGVREENKVVVSEA